MCFFVSVISLGFFIELKCTLSKKRISIYYFKRCYELITEVNVIGRFFILVDMILEYSGVRKFIGSSMRE